MDATQQRRSGGEVEIDVKRLKTGTLQLYHLCMKQQQINKYMESFPGSIVVPVKVPLLPQNFSLKIQ